MSCNGLCIVLESSTKREGMRIMKSKWSFVLPFLGLLSVCHFPSANVYAKESLDDGILWLTKTEINDKLGTPNYLYSEEEPFRRYMIVKPDQENSLRATFLYDVIMHDFYYVKRDGKNLEYRFYYGEDMSEGKKTFRVKEYSIKFLDTPIALGGIADIVPEFKPAYECSKVYQERLINLNNIRLIFVT